MVYLNIVMRHGLETRLKSLFYLFVHVYANLCTVKTMDFLHIEAIVQWHHLAQSLNRNVEILISKISKVLCTVKPSQHQILAHCLWLIIDALKFAKLLDHVSIYCEIQ